MTYEVRFTRLARDRVREQAAYIAAESGDPATAARWLQQVLATADALGAMPRQGELAEEDAYLPYEIHARRVGGKRRRYVLLYTIVEETRTVWVVNARGGWQRAEPSALPPDSSLQEEGR